MQGTSIPVLIFAAVAALVSSVVWYAVFGGMMAELRGPAVAAPEPRSQMLAMLFVVAQSLVVAFLVAYLASRLGISGPAGAAGLGALVWSFPAAILLGSVVHEGVPLALASIHAGDWLVKLLLIAAIVGAWRRAPHRAIHRTT